MARFCFTKSKSSLAGKNDWADKTKEEFVKVCFDLKCMSYISILRPEIYWKQENFGANGTNNYNFCNHVHPSYFCPANGEIRQ